MKKRFLSAALTVAMAVSMTACSSKPAETAPATEAAAPAETEAAGEETEAKEAAADTGDKELITVGYAQVGAESDWRTANTESFKSTFTEENGYKLIFDDAQQKQENQIKAIRSFIQQDVDYIVVAPVVETGWETVLEEAKEAGIPVISYDRLLMNSDAVTYYATFDNYKVGQKQGEYLVDALDLDNQDGPFNIEMFTGDPADNNCNFFFGGAMDVLQKYIDEGKLVVKSGQTEFEQVATANWDSAKAQDRMDTIIAGNYSDGSNLDAVLCSNDSTALGVENALAASYTGEYPIITGQDCDTPNVKNLVAGKQAMSVFKDTRALATAVVGMVDSIMKGEEPEVNDTESYDNGTGVIPTYLCDPVVVTVDNYKEMLIDSGYYTEDQIK